MTSEKRAQKFNIDDASLSRSFWAVLLSGWKFLLPHFSYDYPPKGRLIVVVNFVVLLAFVGKAALFIAQVVSSETVTK